MAGMPLFRVVAAALGGIVLSLGMSAVQAEPAHTGTDAWIADPGVGAGARGRRPNRAHTEAQDDRAERRRNYPKPGHASHHRSSSPATSVHLGETVPTTALYRAAGLICQRRGTPPSIAPDARPEFVQKSRPQVPDDC